MLKVKAEEHRTKDGDPSGASDTLCQVRGTHHVRASKPDFDYLAHSVMFSVSEAEEAEEKKRVRQEDSGDKENNEDSMFHSIAPPTTPPRRRGRPPKTKVSDLPEITEYLVSVYIEVEKPPKKSSRGKSDEQTEGDWLRGPVTVTRETTWEGFLRDVAGAVETRVGRLHVKSLRWTTMADPTEKPKARAALVQWLPMTNNAGFAAFVSNGILATRGTRTFLVKMSPPGKAVRTCFGLNLGIQGLMISNMQPWEIDEGQGTDDDPELDDSDDEPPSKKKKKPSKKNVRLWFVFTPVDPLIHKTQLTGQNRIGWPFGT